MKPILVSILLLCWCCTPERSTVKDEAVDLPALAPIDGGAAMELVKKQLAFGPRHVNSAAAKKCAAFIADFARKHGYNVKVDIWSEGSGTNSRVFRNIICTKVGKGTQSVVCGSHYDTKILKQYPDFIGANDGASSTGLMMHIMEQISQSENWNHHCTIQFVFFDGEEAIVNYTASDGLNGSRRFVRNMYLKGENTRCRAMILMDMVGDKDFKLTIPSNSTEALVQKTLAIARRLGFSEKVSILDAPGFHDDHKPFLQAGIPAINLIDFEYGEKNDNNGAGTFWHTDEDTIDKLSPQSLEICGMLFKHLLWQLSNNPIIQKE